LQNVEKSANVEDSETEEEGNETEIVQSLPKAKTDDEGQPKKKYTFIEPGAGIVDESEEEQAGEESESSGSTED
jgi:hypothetical protein